MIWTFLTGWTFDEYEKSISISFTCESCVRKITEKNYLRCELASSIEQKADLIATSRIFISVFYLVRKLCQMNTKAWHRLLATLAAISFVVLRLLFHPRFGLGKVVYGFNQKRLRHISDIILLNIFYRTRWMPRIRSSWCSYRMTVWLNLWT